MIICLTSANGSGGQPESSRLDRCLLGIADEDPQALADLYDCTSASVYAFALSILKNTQDAQADGGYPPGKLGAVSAGM